MNKYLRTSLMCLSCILFTMSIFAQTYNIQRGFNYVFESSDLSPVEYYFDDFINDVNVHNTYFLCVVDDQMNQPFKSMWRVSIINTNSVILEGNNPQTGDMLADFVVTTHNFDEFRRCFIPNKCLYFTETNIPVQLLNLT